MLIDRPAETPRQVGSGSEAAGSLAQIPEGAPPPSMRRIFRTWWPLAGSWILMGLELPVVSAIMARLADPEISLAAYGGVVFPLSMIVEAPIIMLLSASTVLSKDWRSYLLLRRFMMRAGLCLTVIHILVAFTPLYDVVVGKLIHPPAEVLEPARWGLMIMTPWTWSIAYRRFQQGVLIRFGRSHLVGIGTIIRLSTTAAVLTVGYLSHALPGIVIGSLGVALGVMAEAVFIGVAVRPVLKAQLRTAPALPEPLTTGAFLHFYVPLALTSLLQLAGAPIVSAGLGRMPRALDSLAVWPVITGLTFTLRSLGFAFNEVVVALLEEPGSARNLRRFALILGASTSAVLLLLAATPLSRLYFEGLSALSPTLARLATQGLPLLVLMPGLSAVQSWVQGKILHGRRTRGITEAVGVYLVASTLVLVAGAVHGAITGLFVGAASLFFGSLLQVGWLWLRGRRMLQPAAESSWTSDR